MFIHFTASFLTIFSILRISTDKCARAEVRVKEGHEFRYERNAGYFGIPVPGQTVSAMEVFKYVSKSCRPSNGQYQERNLIAESLKVLDSRSVHKEKCVVSYYNIVQNSTFLTTFTMKDYFRKGDNIHTILGHGSKTGPDAGQLLFHTGHPEDTCPYVLVKAGPPDERGQYEYIILSHILKHPVMGLARDPKTFELYYKEEVDKFLHKHNFINPLTTRQSPVTFEDFTKCTPQYYFNLMK